MPEAIAGLHAKHEPIRTHCPWQNPGAFGRVQPGESARLSWHERMICPHLLQGCDADVRPDGSLWKFVLAGPEEVQHDYLRILQPQLRIRLFVLLGVLLNPKL